MMSDYEPKSGWNLPPGCFEDDPMAPWNRPDPWVGRTCAECRHCQAVKLMDGMSIDICTFDDCAMEEIDRDQAACEGFEG